MNLLEKLDTLISRNYSHVCWHIIRVSSGEVKAMLLTINARRMESVRSIGLTETAVNTVVCRNV